MHLKIDRYICRVSCLFIPFCIVTKKKKKKTKLVILVCVFIDKKKNNHTLDSEIACFLYNELSDQKIKYIA